MATTYTATLRIKCWKRHQCVHCKTRFGYEFRRVIKGTGGTEAKASAAAEKFAVASIEKDVDIEPCPACGLIQPDMVAARRRVYHFWLNWGSLLVPIPIFIGLGHGIPYSQAYGTAAGVGTFLLLAHGLVARMNPNRNLAANQAKADARLEGERIQILELGQIPDEIPTFARGGWGPGEIGALGILLAGVLLLLLPEGMLKLNGWTENENAFPGVVSAGSTNRYYFAQKFEVVKRHWGGQGLKVSVREAEAYDPKAPVLALTHAVDWGNQIVAKSVEKNSRITPHVDITAPEFKAGFTGGITFDVSMTLHYPQMVGDKFANQESQLTGSFPVEISPPGSGDSFRLYLLIAGIAGPPLILLGGLLLAAGARALAKQALPTQITTDRNEGAEPERTEGDGGEPRRS